MDKWLQLIGTIGIYVSAFEAVLFVILYGFAAPWTRSVFGRFLFFSNAVLAVIFTFFAVRLIFGEHQILVVLRTVVFGMVPVYLGWQLWLFYRVQSQKEVQSNGHRRS
jgi:hypothetical protein